MKHSKLLCGFLAAAFMSCSSGQNVRLIDPPTEERRTYSPMFGSFPVGVIPEATVRDAARGKDVPISLEYPTRPGPHPVILFSPVLGGSRRDYAGLSSYWVSHGYVVIRVSHADTGLLKDPRDAATLFATQTAEDWRNRARDLSAVVDNLATLESKYPELKGRIDASRIGAGGHGLGALTALMLGGLVPQKSGARVDATDRRIKAVVAMAPPAREDAGLTDDSWRAVTVPVLTMIGSAEPPREEREEGRRRRQAPQEEKPPAEPVRWNRESFDLTPAGDKYLVSIRGLRPMSFTGRLMDLDDAEIERRREAAMRATTAAPGSITAVPPEGVMDMIASRERRVFAAIKSSALAFWDGYLLGKKEGREFLSKLTGESLKAETR